MSENRKTRGVLKLSVILFLITVVSMSCIPSQATRIGRGQRGVTFTTSEGYFGISFNMEFDEIGLWFRTCYASTIDLDDWKITDNKDLMIDLELLQTAPDYEFWVEHMHCDCFIESTMSYWDGVIQDTMDDSYHGTGAPGFYIDENNSYSETFSVEGLSSYMTSYFTFYVNHYAWTTSETDRLTEDKLRTIYEVYGISFRVIYDVCYHNKNDPDTYISKFIVENNIIVDLTEGFLDNEGDRADKEVSEGTFGFELPIVIGAIIAGGIYVKKKRK